MWPSYSQTFTDMPLVLFACTCALSACRQGPPFGCPYPWVVVLPYSLRCGLLPCACVRVHRVCASEGRNVAVLLDLEGGTVRSSFLIDHATKKRISKIELKVRCKRGGEHGPCIGSVVGSTVRRSVRHAAGSTGTDVTCSWQSGGPSSCSRKGSAGVVDRCCSVEVPTTFQQCCSHS